MYFDLACSETAISPTSDVLSSFQPFIACFENYLLSQVPPLNLLYLFSRMHTCSMLLLVYLSVVCAVAGVWSMDNEPTLCIMKT